VSAKIDALSRAALWLLIDALFHGKLAVMAAIQTARQRARAELTAEIKAEARRQLAAEGAQRLSLRAVARELGMASSALYRYFPSRDDLLTALIIDAYDAIGRSAERSGATVPASDILGRWRACCHAVRGWALAHPHEYALIYGSPVPGYQAPQETVASATRVSAVLGALLADSCSSRAPGSADDGQPGGTGSGGAGPGGASGRADAARQVSLPQPLAGQAAAIAAAVAAGVPGPMMTRGLIAWTQLFGMVSFELFGQFAGVMEPADAFFGFAVDQMAAFVGLPR
jgi:AcrR family transcriptional regulator